MPNAARRWPGWLATTVFVAVATFASPAKAYNLGGISCTAAPTNFGFYCFGGAGLDPYRAAVANPANFGPGGTVAHGVSTTPLASFGPADLAGVDGVVVPWWLDAEAAPHVAALTAYFLGGGDLFILADDSAHDPLNAALGVPTFDTGGSATPKPTTGSAPLHAGPFGFATAANQVLNIGRLDVATVLLRNGRIVSADAEGNVTAAVWDRGDYAPGAGRLVIVTDVDMIVPPQASYAPLNDNGRFALNATAFLVAGGAIDAFAYDLVGVPSCAITPGGFGFYCGTDGVLLPLRDQLRNPANFGPAGVVPRRAALAAFDTFTPALAALLKAVIVPWVENGSTATYGAALRDWYLAGGNLFVLQDDPLHHPVGSSLGVPTVTSTGVATPRPTNGSAPAYDGPFGIAADVGQLFNVGGLSPADVAAHNGAAVGIADNGDLAVAAWGEGDYASGAGRMVIATDVDAIFLPTFGPANRTWALNIMAFLLGDHDATAPTILCAASPDRLWPANGKPVNVTVTGTIADAGVGLEAGSAAYAVTDEYGQPQPAGSIVVGAGGAYSFIVPLVASRNGSDLDGRSYAVVVSAADRAGNVGTCSVTVVVPHDQRR